MAIELTVRHATIKVAVQARAHKLAEKLCEDFPQIESLRVIFDFEGKGKAQQVLAQISTQGGQSTTIDASAKDPDAAAALNAAFDKASAQLRRASKKRQETRK